jgi:hypothetical protein
MVVAAGERGFGFRAPLDGVCTLNDKAVASVYNSGAEAGSANKFAGKGESIGFSAAPSETTDALPTKAFGAAAAAATVALVVVPPSAAVALALFVAAIVVNILCRSSSNVSETG